MIDQNLGELLEDKVTLDIEGIDRSISMPISPCCNRWRGVGLLQATSWRTRRFHHVDGADEPNICCGHSPIFQAECPGEGALQDLRRWSRAVKAEKLEFNVSITAAILI
jgi:hypothetical protein